MMSKLHLHVKSLTMFVHVVTTTTWMIKNHKGNGFGLNPCGELTFMHLEMMKINMHFENDENKR